MNNIYDVIIIGSGPAGYTAALYAARANLKVIIIAGSTPGGQLMLTGQVENFPGFPDGILGPELMERMREQAMKFGAEIIYDEAIDVDFSSHPYKVKTLGEEYLGYSVIIATGAAPRWLGLDSEKRLIGRGVSSCATCDAPLFKNAENIVIVGGGDSAMEYALFTANIAKKVTVIHRRDKLRASKIMQERAFSNPKIKFVWNSIVTDIIGQDRVEGVKVKNLQSNEEFIIQCNAVFVAIGHQPSTSIFKNKLEMDDDGHIITREFVKTSVPGVFAAGDVHDKKYRQAITAAGLGCMAALEAIRYLEEIKMKIK